MLLFSNVSATLFNDEATNIVQEVLNCTVSEWPHMDSY